MEGVSENQFWDVTALSAGLVDSIANDSVVAAFDNASATEVDWGDGITTRSGATNLGLLYKNPD